MPRKSKKVLEILESEEELKPEISVELKTEEIKVPEPIFENKENIYKEQYMKSSVPIGEVVCNTLKEITLDTIIEEEIKEELKDEIKEDIEEDIEEDIGNAEEEKNIEKISESNYLIEMDQPKKRKFNEPNVLLKIQKQWDTELKAERKRNMDIEKSLRDRLNEVETKFAHYNYYDKVDKVKFSQIFGKSL